MSSLAASSLRLLVGALLAAWLVMSFGERLGAAFLRLLEWSYAHLDDSVTIKSLAIDAHGAVGGHDRVYRLVVSPARAVFINGKFAYANAAGEATVTVLTAYLWQALLTAMPFAFAWPALHRGEWLVRALILPAILFAFALIDLPFVLWAQIWQMYVDAYDPQRLSPLLLWAKFLQGGGRFLLGLIAAAVCVSLARIVSHLREGSTTSRVAVAQTPPKTSPGLR